MLLAMIMGMVSKGTGKNSNNDNDNRRRHGNCCKNTLHGKMSPELPKVDPKLVPPIP